MLNTPAVAEEDSQVRAAADLAARIIAVDRVSGKRPPGMRFQWNVPRGVKPDVTLGFAMLVIALLFLIPLLSLLLP